MDAPTTIDLNADLGEGFPWDEALLALVTSASIACAAHAGDRDIARRTLREAKRRGVIVGAHPGYDDREGFGRRDRNLTGDEVVHLIRGQVSFLAELADGEGAELHYVKPHGALYNQAQKDGEVASAVVAALLPLKLPVLGQPGGRLEAVAEQAGLRFVAEGFPDRRYLSDGRLVPRSEPGSILNDPVEIEAQVLRLVGLGVATLCLHGDHPESVALARLVRDTLNRAGVELRGFV